MNNSILEQAANWVDSLEHLTEQEQQELEAWLNASPEHQAAFEKLNDTWQSNALSAALQVAQDSQINRRHVDNTSITKSNRLSSAWGALAASIAVLAVLYFTWPNDPMKQAGNENSNAIASNSQQTQTFSTQVAETRSQILKDGSALYMSAASKLAVSMAPTSRRVELAHGQVFFDISSDKQRPFTVDLPNAQVVVLGTAFDIFQSENKTRIDVYEGRVSVNAEQSIVLTAGMSISLAHGKLSPVSRFTDQQLPHWRSGWLIAEDMSIAEVITRLQPWSEQQIELAGELNPETRITGRFKLNDIDSSARLVAESQGWKIINQSERILLTQ